MYSLTDKVDIQPSPQLIAAYYRVSTATQEENQTIETQILAVKDFAAKNGYRIVREYADDGWSGDTLIRPSLDQLRVDAKQKTWEAVLVYDPDRIARRYSYQELVMDELKEAGIEVIFVTTPAPKNSEDKILHGVKGLFAEYERAKISERFRLGKLRKVKEGHILLSEGKYGYTYIPMVDKIHGYCVINEDEAKVVRMIFAWVADEGLTLRAVVRRLRDLEIRPRKSKRGVWSTSTLTTLLRHKVYIGEAHWGSSYAVAPVAPAKNGKYRKIRKSSRKPKPEAEWYIIPIPKIIDRELYDRARTRLETNSALAQRNKKNDYLLSGKLWCVCGRRRGGNSPLGGRYLYYACTDRMLSFPLPPNCREKYLSARVADRLVWEKLADLMSSPELMLKQVENWFHNQRNKPQSSEVEIQDLVNESVKIKEQEERYNKAYGTGLISIAQLSEYTIPLRERTAAIKARIAQSQQRVSGDEIFGSPTEKQINAFASEAAHLMLDLSFKIKRNIVLKTIDKVISTQTQLKIYGKIPIKDVLLCSQYKHDENAIQQNQTPFNLKVNAEQCSIHRHSANAIPLLRDSIDTLKIPFYFEIELPPTLKRGVDYGFKKGESWIFN